ncbi:MAG TPA: S41 family peptidase, partial [Firmicutes bacterium]|nr:S41 family peptidase [Bacillota bacterium]
LIRENYRGYVSWPDLWRGAIAGMVKALNDPYSVYFSPKEADGAREVEQKSAPGVGLVLDLLDGYVTVVAPVPDGPADRAGIAAGDRLVSVNGRSLRFASVGEAVVALQGSAGSSVTVEVARPGLAGTVTFQLKREADARPSIRVQVLAENIAYLRIASFANGTGRNLAAIVRMLRDRNIHRYVLDLRDNPGGSVEEALEVASVFIPSGPVCYVMDKKGIRRALQSQSLSWNFRLVVLVNRGTASSAEMVAAAVQDRRVGTVVGVRTFGKGAMQSVYDLEDGGVLKLTVGVLQSPLGRPISNGVVPDITVARGPRLSPDPTTLSPLRVNSKLAKGARGTLVRTLQEWLLAAGFDPGPIDGVFGDRTRSAVVKFQGASGLRPDGVVTPEVASRLMTAPFGWPRSRPAGSDPQLDKAIQVLMAAP